MLKICSFLGLNCCTISCNISPKNNSRAASGGTTFESFLFSFSFFFGCFFCGRSRHHRFQVWKVDLATLKVATNCETTLFTPTNTQIALAGKELEETPRHCTRNSIMQPNVDHMELTAVMNTRNTTIAMKHSHRTRARLYVPTRSRCHRRPL